MLDLDQRPQLDETITGPQQTEQYTQEFEHIYDQSQLVKGRFRNYLVDNRTPGFADELVPMPDRQIDDILLFQEAFASAIQDQRAEGPKDPSSQNIEHAVVLASALYRREVFDRRRRIAVQKKLGDFYDSSLKYDEFLYSGEASLRVNGISVQEFFLDSKAPRGLHPSQHLDFLYQAYSAVGNPGAVISCEGFFPDQFPALNTDKLKNVMTGTVALNEMSAIGGTRITVSTDESELDGEISQRASNLLNKMTHIRTAIRTAVMNPRHKNHRALREVFDRCRTTDIDGNALLRILGAYSFEDAANLYRTAQRYSDTDEFYQRLVSDIDQYVKGVFEPARLLTGDEIGQTHVEVPEHERTHKQTIKKLQEVHRDLLPKMHTGGVIPIPVEMNGTYGTARVEFPQDRKLNTQVTIPVELPNGERKFVVILCNSSNGNFDWHMPQKMDEHPEFAEAVSNSAYLVLNRLRRKMMREHEQAQNGVHNGHSNGVMQPGVEYAPAKPEKRKRNGNGNGHRNGNGDSIVDDYEVHGEHENGNGNHIQYGYHMGEQMMERYQSLPVQVRDQVDVSLVKFVDSQGKLGDFKQLESTQFGKGVPKIYQLDVGDEWRVWFTEIEDGEQGKRDFEVYDILPKKAAEKKLRRMKS